MLHKLFRLLADDDFQTSRLTDPIAALLKGSAVEMDFQRLGILAARYDFEAALEALRAIAGKLGAKLV